MSDTRTAVVNLFKFDTGVYLEKVATLSDEELTRRPCDTANPTIWIAGHLASSRNHLLNLYGGEIEFPWGDLFNKAYDASADYPGIGELSDNWKTVSEQLLPLLEKADAATLTKDIGYKLPIGVTTVEGATIFWLYHESWHLGQVSLERRERGQEGLVPY